MEMGLMYTFYLQMTSGSNQILCLAQKLCFLVPRLRIYSILLVLLQDPQPQWHQCTPSPRLLPWRPQGGSVPPLDPSPWGGQHIVQPFSPMVMDRNPSEM